MLISNDKSGKLLLAGLTAVGLFAFLSTPSRAEEDDSYSLGATDVEVQNHAVDVSTPDADVHVQTSQRPFTRKTLFGGELTRIVTDDGQIVRIRRRSPLFGGGTVVRTFGP